MKYLIISLLFIIGCGKAPVAGVTDTNVTTQTASGVVCPSGTSLVQNKTCEEMTAHANATQVAAAAVCSNQVMHLCSIAERTGQFALAHQEIAGQHYWLSDFIGGNGYVIQDAQPSVATLATYPYFCCVGGQ